MTVDGQLLMGLSAESGCAWSTPYKSGNRARHVMAMMGVGYAVGVAKRLPYRQQLAE